MSEKKAYMLKILQRVLIWQWKCHGNLETHICSNSLNQDKWTERVTASVVGKNTGLGVRQF